MSIIARRRFGRLQTSDDGLFESRHALAATTALASVLIAATAAAQEVPKAEGTALPPVVVDSPSSKLGRQNASRSRAQGSQATRSSTPAQQPSNVVALPAITVYGERPAGPADGIVAHATTAGTKTDTPINQVPQAVSVVTREQMDQQNALSVGDSLRYTPGVFADSRVGGVLESVFLRGFGGFATSATIPQMLDGLPLMAGTGWAQQVIDPSTLDRVEVLRGPASVIYGQATPGGVVNMVSKTPTDTPYHDIGIETGNRNRIQGSFDFGGPITDDGVWSYRLNGLARRADEQVDFSKQQRIVLAPTLSWKPDTNTKLTLFGFYQNDPDNNFAGWLPAKGTVFPNAAGRIPRAFFLGEPGYDDYTRQQYMIGYEFEHHFDDTWAVRQNFRYSHVNTDFEGIAGNYLDPYGSTSSELNRLVNWGHETLDGIALDNQIEYRVRTGPLRHTFLAGVSYYRTMDDDKVSNYTYVPSINYLAPVYGQSFNIPPLVTNTHQVIDQVGVYLQDQVRLDRLVITLGGREDWSSIDTQNRLTGGTLNQDDSAFTGRVGAVYLFDNGFAPYVSYATSFQPTAGVNASGGGYKPSKGEQTEIGLRYEPKGWNASFITSLFDIHRTNVSVTDPNNPLYYVQTGEVHSRGVEFEAQVALTNNLDLVGAYTYLDTTVEKDTDSSIIGNRLVAVPTHVASVWANYKFMQDPLNGLSFGGGVRYIGKSAADDANSFYVPDTTLFDVALRYDLGAAHQALKGWRLAANVSNLFDRTYVASCFSTGGCFYGNGRVVTASIHYSW